MPTSRQRILDFFDKNHVVTVDEISRALAVTQANVRHHLAILQDHGLVKVVGKRPAQNKGRPSLLFSLSSKYKGNTLEIILSALLSEINHSQSAEINAFLTRLARRVAGLDRGEPGNPNLTNSSQQLTLRLLSTVERLSDLNYRPHWEAHIEGPRIILGNCPYLSILDDHPELCAFDRFLIEELISKPVEQLAKLNMDERNIPYCMFRVREK
jgi:predicted ArsR family transcriptional regulator